jgi:hypothetical protein
LFQPDHQTKTGEETTALSKDRLVEWIKNDNDLEAFGAAAVCLSDCRLQQPATQKKKSSDKFGLKKENGKPHKTSLFGRGEN